MSGFNFRFEPGAEEEILRSCDNAFETDLGPKMKAEVIDKVPVDTGALVDSVYMEVDRKNHELNVGALGDEEREDPKRRYYAVYVEMGARHFYWGYDSGMVQQPRPFLRPALYRRYAGW